MNLTGRGRVDMSNFELLKVLGTGGKCHSLSLLFFVKNAFRAAIIRFVSSLKSTSLAVSVIRFQGTAEISLFTAARVKTFSAVDSHGASCAPVSTY